MPTPNSVRIPTGVVGSNGRRGKSMAREIPNRGDPERKKRNVRNLIESAEFFGAQYTGTADLPNPEQSLQILATGVVEVISGMRQVDQLAGLLSDDVYQRLSKRAIEAQQSREAKGQKAHHQMFAVQKMMSTSPRDGVIESVVVLNGQKRSRAVSIRLEGINQRWRATALSIL